MVSDGDDVNNEFQGQGRVDPKELDGVFQMIRKIENRKFIYDATDPKHSKRDLLTAAWTEIATDVIVNGKEMSAGEWCKNKWKMLRDYYYKKEKDLKGKSGQARDKKKPWIYFTAMDRVLSSTFEENENTISNFDRDDSEVTLGSDNRPNEAEVNQEWFGMGDDESTPEIPKRKESSRYKERKRKAADDDFNKKLLKAIEEPDTFPDADEFYHFGMTISKKLRKLPPRIADFAMTKLTALLYDITYPQYNSYGEYAQNESTQNESL